MTRTWRGCVFIGTSLDGYIAKPDGDLSWLTAPEPREHAADEGDHPALVWETFFPTVDTLVMGRTTYDTVSGFDDSRGLRGAADGLQSALSGRLGQPSGSQDGDRYWELGSGGRIWLKTVPKKVLLVVEGQRFADVERGEERLGIGPDLTLGAGDGTD